MKRILIDTNVYAAFKRNSPNIVRTLQTFEEIHISTTVLGELLSGFKAGSREVRNREELKTFLNNPRVFLDYLDESTAEFYSHIYLLLRAKGSPIPTNDIWIAAAAMQRGLGLYTRDSHFTAIDGLLLVQTLGA